MHFCKKCQPLSTGYLPRAEADEALRRLGELRHLIDEFNEWGTAGSAPQSEYLGWLEKIVDLATRVVGL